MCIYIYIHIICLYIYIHIYVYVYVYVYVGRFVMGRRMEQYMEAEVLRGFTGFGVEDAGILLHPFCICGSPRETAQMILYFIFGKT